MVWLQLTHILLDTLEQQKLTWINFDTVTSLRSVVPRRSKQSRCVWQGKTITIIEFEKGNNIVVRETERTIHRKLLEAKSDNR